MNRTKGVIAVPKRHRAGGEEKVYAPSNNKPSTLRKPKT